MEKFLFIFVLIPFLGFLVNVFVPKANEKLMSRIAFSTMALQYVITIFFTVFWFLSDQHVLFTKEMGMHKTGLFDFFYDFCFDKVTAVYLLVGSSLSFLITAYSRTYLHREGGYKRFFNTIMFFFLGYNILVLSGNLATLFIGWEVAGVSSFLLIGFYRERYIPVKNSVKVFSIYRIGDVALILALWASHHLYHQNVGLIDIGSENQILTEHHKILVIFLSCMILIAACIKSAQIPFSSWLPRAMEGPTPSSAIFYSSLSVHLGVLLLLRTHYFWENFLFLKILIIGIGFFTFLIATSTAKVQSSVKGQIAYSSIAQIGLMFIEVALGLHWLAIIHFAGNAFLRSYQILISPSIVTYLIRDQFYNFSPIKKILNTSFTQKIKNTFFIINLEEWYMDGMMHHAIWNLLKRIGKKLGFIAIGTGSFILAAVVVGAIMLLNHPEWKNEQVVYYLPIGIALIGVLFSLRSFVEKKNVFLAWYLVVTNHFFVILAVLLTANVEPIHLIVYLGGIIPAAIGGHLCLRQLSRDGIALNLNWYQGHSYEYPKINFLFLVCCLGLIGFPVTPAFLGIELFYGYIHTHQIIRLFLISLGLLVNSLSLIRIYSRIFLGPHIKTYHESASKSS